MTLVTLLLTNAAVSAVAFVGLWLMGLKLRDVSFVDAWWGLGMALLAVSTLVQVGKTPHGVLLTGLCAVWAVRLGGHLFFRWREQGPDRRYAAMMGHAQTVRGWSFAMASGLIVFALQFALQFVVALPVQLGQVMSARLGPLALAGTVLTLVGVIFESVGDWQLVRFKADPAKAGQVLDSGLWRYTRHPNYFGDACVWWGLYLIAAETGLGLWALPGPVLITLLLTKGSGAPTVEGHLRQHRPGYEAYVARTSGFIPWWPKA